MIIEKLQVELKETSTQREAVKQAQDRVRFELAEAKREHQTLTAKRPETLGLIALGDLPDTAAQERQRLQKLAADIEDKVLVLEWLEARQGKLRHTQNELEADLRRAENNSYEYIDLKERYGIQASDPNRQLVITKLRTLAKRLGCEEDLQNWLAKVEAT